MTDTPSPPRDGGSNRKEGEDDGDGTLSAEAVYEAMDPLEPYTTSEIASVLGVPKRIVRGLLNRLAEEETIRRKEPEPKRLIWIREPPKHECPNCGGEFEVKYFHPVFQAVQFCPKCGTRLRRRDRD
jgi:transcription initiation factor IIE alpha subunit